MISPLIDITVDSALFAFVCLFRNLVTSDAEEGGRAGWLVSLVKLVGPLPKLTLCAWIISRSTHRCEWKCGRPGILLIVGRSVNLSRQGILWGGVSPSEWMTVNRHRSISQVIFWARLALQGIHCSCYWCLQCPVCWIHIYPAVDGCTLKEPRFLH